MAALTLTTLNAQVRDLVGDPSNSGTGANTYSDPQITDAINYAIQDLCTRMHFTYVEKDLTATTPWSSFTLGSIAQDYISIRRIMLKNSGTSPASYTELLQSTYAQEDLRNNAWRQLTADMSTGFPLRWILQDGETIVAIPRPTAAYPSGTTVTLTIGYVQQPTALASGTDPVDARIPFPIQIYLKYAAASWLKVLSGKDITDLNQAKAWMDQFNAYIQEGGPD